VLSYKDLKVNIQVRRWRERTCKHDTLEGGGGYDGRGGQPTEEFREQLIALI
jgi:hypothetical protein